MKARTGLILAALTLLGGCGEAAPEAPEAAASDAMPMESEVKSGKGTGTVTAVNAAAGTVTLDHEAMPEVGWPAMTMSFKADPALLAGIEEGDKVAFDLTLSGGSGEITALAVE